jgi:hypothetical protein
MVPNPNASITNDDLYEFQDFNDGTTVADTTCCALSPSSAQEPHDFSTVYTLTAQHGAVPIYFLPSRANQISCIDLDATLTNGRPKIVLTTAVNGCSIFVTCANTALPLNQANSPKFYHANGIHAHNGGTVVAARASTVNYTRQLLRDFVMANGQHLALELTSQHYYGSDIVDETNLKTQLGYTVNNAQASTDTFLVMGVMSLSGIWSFYYQRHVDIDYTRTGKFKVFLKGSQFQGQKTRVSPLHVPNAADWGGTVP